MATADAAATASAPTGPITARRKVPEGPNGTILLLVGITIALVVGSLISITFGQTVVLGLVQGASFASLSVALVIIYRATGVFNFAQGEMATATTYVMYQLNVAWHVTYWLAFALTLAFAFVFGAVIYVLFIRPVERRSIVAVIIITIALFVLIDGVVSWIFPPEPLYMTSPFSPKVIGSGLGVGVNWQDLGTLLTTLGSVFLMYLLFNFTKLGLGMRAAAFRPGPARLVGVRVSSMLAFGWGVAAVLGAVSGIMYEATVPYVLTTSLMANVLLYSFVSAVIGGLESPLGAVVGAMLFGITLSLVTQYVGFIGTDLQVPFALGLLLIMLLFRPNGLFGKTEVARV
jgi:branched-chain amino acid transport system permease protein